MISIFEGRLGGGKSYHAAILIARALSEGRRVYTNLAVKPKEIIDYVESHFRKLVDPAALVLFEDENIRLFHRHSPNNCLVVIDEAHLWFNARDWAQADREVLNFMTQSRKYQTDVVFISQSAENIDKQLRRLVGEIWRFRDMQKWTIPGLGMKFPLPVFLQCLYDYDGRTLLHRKWSRKDKAVYGIYDTAAVYSKKFDRLEAPPLATIERARIRLSWPLRVAWAAIAVLAGFTGGLFL